MVERQAFLQNDVGEIQDDDNVDDEENDGAGEIGIWRGGEEDCSDAASDEEGEKR